MSRYITTKADFTLRKTHKKGSGTTIYENDYTTINPMPNALKGEYVIGDSNFVFTSRLGINAQKKHVRGKFVPNPMGEESAWTIDTIIDSGITDETKIRLKPNYTSIKDFACYGSAVKLIQGTINGVIQNFPAEMYFSNETISFYDPDQGKAGLSFNEANGGKITEFLLYNEYGIDIVSKNINEEDVYNPLRYFTLCGTSYTLISDNVEKTFVGFSSQDTSSGECYNGKSVEVDKISSVKLNFNGEEIDINVYKDYTDGSVFYTYNDTGLTESHIRPKKEIVEEYFRTCDDFTAVLLDRLPKPIYTAIFETPRETDTGYTYDMRPYTWPTLNGGFNPDLSLGYYAYVESLISLGEFYDDFYSDNMWRSLTHEAIKTLDWTYVSNSDGDIQDMSTIDTSRVEPITKIYGRQFDDLKRYADGIKSINTITYNQKSNTPDYTLTDVLENSGWETRNLQMTGDKAIYTDSLYSGLTNGYSEKDANIEFLRRLKLNSNYLLSAKGTRKGLDAMLSMFGFVPGKETRPGIPSNAVRYDIHEKAFVFNGTGQYTHFCNKTTGKSFLYPLAEDVATINKYKINYNALDPYTDYCGIPVTEVGYQKNGQDYSYVIPWYSRGKKYDDDLYFQMHGGWGKRGSTNVNVDIAPNVSTITSFGDSVVLYSETQARLKFAGDFDDLLQQAGGGANRMDVCYVTDLGDIDKRYTTGPGETIGPNCSHYFVLENEDLNMFLGCSDVDGRYGWRNIKVSEIQNPSTNSAGTLVLYLESIKDDTTGNNPHTGNGTYDDGMSYISGMSQIFNYSLLNQNFIGIDDTTCRNIAGYKFIPTGYEDNRKCWFFSDDYNTGATKDGSGRISFIEADVTNGICDITVPHNPETDLASKTLNKLASVGTSASEYMSGYDTIYTRGTKLVPIDPENYVGQNGEAAANSIVNVKNIEVHFTLPNGQKERLKNYIETSVIPYLTQMIPSTAILSWGYDEDSPVSNYTYEIILSPNTPQTIDSTGTTSFRAYYVTKKNGTEVSRIDITRYANVWTSSNPAAATVSQGVVTGKNTSTTEKTTTITVSYGYAEPKSVNVTVNPAAALTIAIAAPSTIAATDSTIPYTATTTGGSGKVRVLCDVYINTAKTGTFTVGENNTYEQKRYVVSAYCVDDSSVWTSTIVDQEAKTQPTGEWIISLTAEPEVLGVNGGTVTYTVVTGPTGNEEVIVKVDNEPFSPMETKQGTFTFGKNLGSDEITHKIIASLKNNPSETREISIVQQCDSSVPTIELIAEPGTVLASATEIGYRVKSNVITVVKYNESERQHSASPSRGSYGTFSIQPNEGATSVDHVITAYCRDYPDVTATTTVTQQGKQEDYFYFLDDDYFYFLDDDPGPGEKYFRLVIDDNQTLSTRSIKQNISLASEPENVEEEVSDNEEIKSKKSRRKSTGPTNKQKAAKRKKAVNTINEK